MAAAKIASGSAIRPGPNSPHAIAPSSGPTKARRPPPALARLRWVAACSHIRTFIAGAISTGLSVASSAVEARSPARPPAAFAIRSAVAGATTTRSADRDSSMWPICASSVRLKRSERTGVLAERGQRQRVSRTGRPPRSESGCTATPALRRAARAQRLIGRHAAADDQKHATLGQSPDPPENAPLLSRRFSLDKRS